MTRNEESGLWNNLNRLVIILSVLFILKAFTYFFVEFIPIFGQVLGQIVVAFLPFIFAIVFAFLLEPVVVYFMKSLRLGRTYAAFFTLLLAMTVAGIFIFIIMARLYNELSELAVTLPNYNNIVDFLTRQVNTLEKFVNLNPQIQTAIFSSTESILNSFQHWAKAGSVILLSFLASLPGIFIVLVVSIIATLFMSSSYPSVKRFIEGLFPTHWRSSAHVIGEDLGTAIVGFLRAEVILVSVTTFTIIFGLLLLGNRYAVTLGVISGILDIIPIVGTGMLFVPWIIFLFLIGSFWSGIKLLILWVVTVVIRQLLEPKIMSQSIGLHPLPTLISMYVGLQLLGGLGLILGPATLIVYEAVRKSGLRFWK
ncbi:MAG: sporulation integral membrane protein YtvI [Desulfitobacterium hafniense]|nr:sporulation integral membrane protein YtvI [Desulfitobacterium hafniense]